MNLLQDLKFPQTFGVFTVIHMHSFLDHARNPWILAGARLIGPSSERHLSCRKRSKDIGYVRICTSISTFVAEINPHSRITNGFCGGVRVPSGDVPTFGKSPFLRINSSIRGPFSMAMLNYQRIGWWAVTTGDFDWQQLTCFCFLSPDRWKVPVAPARAPNPWGENGGLQSSPRSRMGAFVGNWCLWVSLEGMEDVGRGMVPWFFPPETLGLDQLDQLDPWNMMIWCVTSAGLGLFRPSNRPMFRQRGVFRFRFNGKLQEDWPASEPADVMIIPKFWVHQRI